MIDRIIEALLVFTIQYWRANSKRNDFKDIAEQCKALIENLEKANISDEEKNEMFDAHIIQLLRSRNQLRE